MDGEFSWRLFPSGTVYLEELIVRKQSYNELEMGKVHSTENTVEFPDNNLVACFDIPNGEAFKNEVNTRHICLENIAIQDRTVSGVVAVKLLSENIDMKIRYTLDSWKNFHETSGQVLTKENRQGDENMQLLEFSVDVPVGTTLEFAICCRDACQDTELWDNNNGKNYKITDVLTT